MTNQVVSNVPSWMVEVNAEIHITPFLALADVLEVRVQRSEYSTNEKATHPHYLDSGDVEGSGHSEHWEDDSLVLAI